MTTIRIHHHPEKTDKVDVDELRTLIEEWREAVDGDSGDTEARTAGDLIDALLGVAGVDYEEISADEERSLAEFRVDDDDAVRALLDIAALMGANERWDSSMLESIAVTINPVMTGADLHAVDSAGDPDALQFWRRMANLRNIGHDGE